MSCFVLSDRHISAIVRYACTSGIGHPAYTPGQEIEACRLLYAANVHSVNTRYGLQEVGDDVTYDPPAQLLTPIEALKACYSLDYQCDEWPDFAGSDAQLLLAAIRAHATRHLPGYNDAAWSIE